MTDHLFVYGSLISAARHPKGQQLRREADLVGPATVHGRLFRVSWYPGITPGGDAGDRVHGELYRLRMPGPTLAWLDAYEGIIPSPEGAAPTGEYARALIDVLDGAGAIVRAWAYLYQLETSGLTRVPSGRWNAVL